MHTVYLYAKRKQHEDFMNRMKSLCVDASDTTEGNLTMQGDHGEPKNIVSGFTHEEPEFEESSCFYYAKEDQWWVCSYNGVTELEKFNTECRSYTFQLNDKNIVYHMMKNVSLGLLSRFAVQEIMKIRKQIPIKILLNGFEVESSNQILSIDNLSTFVLCGDNSPQHHKIPSPFIQKYKPKFGTVPFSFKPCFFMPIANDKKKSKIGVLPSDIPIQIRNVIHSASLSKIKSLITYCGHHIEEKERCHKFIMNRLSYPI